MALDTTAILLVQNSLQTRYMLIATTASMRILTVSTSFLISYSETLKCVCHSLKYDQVSHFPNMISETYHQ